MAKSIYCVITFYLLFSMPLWAQESNQIVDSLQHILKTVPQDTTRVNTLNRLSKELIDLGDNKTALKQAKEALPISEQLKYQKGIADSYNTVGNIYYTQDDYSEALNSFLLALKAGQEIGSEQSLAISYNGIGTIYYAQANYPEALKNFLLALKIREKIGDKQGIANSYNNIGAIYEVQGNYQEALNSFSSSLEIRETIGDKRRIADSYNNIGIVYKKQKKYSQALESHFKCLQIRQELGNKRDIAISYTNIGNVYYEQKNYASSLEMDFKASELYLEIGDKGSLADSWANIGVVYNALEQPSEGIKYSFKALDIAKKIGRKNIIQKAYETLSESYNHLNDCKNAYQYHRLYTQLKDSLFSENNSAKMAKMMSVYQTEKKEKELELLKKEVELKESKSRLLYVGIGFLLLTFSLITWLQVQKNKKNNKILQGEIQLKKQELEFNKNTLAIYTKSLLEKNLLIEELNDKLKDVPINAPTDENIETTKQLISSKIITEEDWERFKSLFEKVHEGFFQKLRSEYQGITTSELRLAALIKLNLSSKEIASMIGISADSVRKTRQRLRKKMELDTEEGLEEMIYKI